MTTRRNFLAASAATAALAAMSKTARAAKSPNERLRLGFIGVGGRAQQHLDSAIHLQTKNQSVEIVSICDVFNRYRDEVKAKVKAGVGQEPTATGDYREILADPTIDAVVIATPDHWHAKQTLDALAAGKNVYCEKPMTHTVEEALAVYQAWKSSGKVMQVGVQSTSQPIFPAIRERLQKGDIGKVLQYQTEYYRNSDVGQWRYYELAKDMNPKNVDWKMFLGTEFGLAPEMPFDRAVFGQWRCYWPFGSGLYTDLFVHRTTAMLLATGLRFPGRVVGGGGIYLEYDGRDVPDVATVVADFPEGVQGLVTATMCSQEQPLKHTIRGHGGSIITGNGEDSTGYDLVAERPQATHDRSFQSERIEIGTLEDSSLTHFDNFVEAARAGDPQKVNCSPELGAAAMTVVKLGAMSYRQGKVFHFDRDTMTISDGNSSWADRWEKMSHDRSKPVHIPGWNAGERGSQLYPKAYQELGGPWTNDVDPAT
ncbi:MAG: Gfo/Idh/MocA family oxidoreductase [Planctomycetia bacterium]|nr:Gfo/Idh/MocA family oxidoreductase [Planctomycetia bacterium]